MRYMMVFVVVAIAMIVQPVDADVFTSVQGGNWNDPATWGLASGSPTPGPGDEIHYGTEGIVTVTESVAFGGPGTASTWTGDGAFNSIYIALQSGVTLTHLAGGTMTYDTTGRTAAYGGNGIENYGIWIHEGGDFNSGNSRNARFTNYGLYLHPDYGPGSSVDFFNRSYTFVNAVDGVFAIDRDYQFDWAQGWAGGSVFQNDGELQLNEFVLQTFRDGWANHGVNLLLNSTGTLQTTLTGHDPDDAGLLNYQGDLVLSGSIQVELDLGFTPVVGDQWTIISIDQNASPYRVSGQFDWVTPGYVASIEDGGTAVVLTAVPEPSTILLMLGAGLFACGRRRRR